MTTLVQRGRSASVAQLQQFMYRVCRPARASSRLMFAIMVALAAPAWHILGRHPACFHFYGWLPGRGNLATIPASLYGRLELTQWAAVAHDPRRAAVLADDGLLALVQDEDPHRMNMLRAIAALWGEQRGIAQRLQPIPSRTDALTLSVGDILLEQALVFVATPELRGGLWLVNVPSDAGCGHGLFEEPQVEGYADSIAVALLQLQGAVGLHWLEMLNGGWPEAQAALGCLTSSAGTEPAGGVNVFTQLPAQELAEAFRLIGEIGELATTWGLTGWLPGEAAAAASKCWAAFNAVNALRVDVAVGQRVPGSR